MRRSWPLVLAIAATVAAGAATSAFGQRGPTPAAQEADACASYAAGAVDQQKDNIARKCGFNGEGWSTNWQVHFDFCKRSDRAAISASTEARSAALRDKCLTEVCETVRERTLLPPFFKTETVCRRVPR